MESPIFIFSTRHNGVSVPSTNVVLQQCLDLVSGDWTAVSNAPTLNLSNLQEELVLPTLAGQTFFRLASP